MPTILHILLAALAIRLAPAPVDTTHKQLTPDACYSLRMGLIGPGANGLTAPEKLPLTIKFTGQNYPILAGVRVLQPSANVEAINYGYWETLSADSVRFGWAYGFTPGGLDIHAKVSNDSIVGTVVFRDMPSAAVTGARVTCPPHLRSRDAEPQH